MEIEKAVNEKFSEIVSSGKIEKMISDALESSIKGIVTDCLREYSDFGKTVKQKVIESLGLGNMKLDFPSYNQLICNHITEIVNAQIIATGKAQIEENLKEFFKPLEKSEYKISEIIEKFKEYFTERTDSAKIQFIADDPSTGICKGYRHFYFDTDSHREKYQCKYNFGITPAGELFSVKIDGHDGDRMKAPDLYGFDSFIFQLFAAKIKIIDDSDDVNIYFEDEE